MNFCSSSFEMTGGVATTVLLCFGGLTPLRLSATSTIEGEAWALPRQYTKQGVCQLFTVPVGWADRWWVLIPGREQERLLRKTFDPSLRGEKRRGNPHSPAVPLGRRHTGEMTKSMD